MGRVLRNEQEKESVAVVVLVACTGLALALAIALESINDSILCDAILISYYI
jgi:hypothetical protein